VTAIRASDDEEVRTAKIVCLRLLVAEIDRQVFADEKIVPVAPEPLQNRDEEAQLQRV